MSGAVVPMLPPSYGDPITLAFEIADSVWYRLGLQGKRHYPVRARWGADREDGRYALLSENLGVVIVWVAPRWEGVRWIRGHHDAESAECQALIAAYLLARSTDAQ